MALFSQRAGIRTLNKAIQRESIDTELRNALWSSFHDTFVRLYSYDKGEHGWSFYPYRKELDRWLYSLWTLFYKAPSDTLPTFKTAITHIRGDFFQAEWHWVFDFLEFSAKHANECGPALVKYANLQLERENSAYRFVGTEIVEITDQIEIAAIEEALTGPKAAGIHLERPVDLMSDRRVPDFRNSIKESISAVETVCRLITESRADTLGAAIKKVSSKAPLHPAFEQALLKLYGFTSDEGGVRHALMEETSLRYSDAKFMLVLCSGFVNFLLTRCAEEGLKMK